MVRIIGALLFFLLCAIPFLVVDAAYFPTVAISPQPIQVVVSNTPLVSISPLPTTSPIPVAVQSLPGVQVTNTPSVNVNNIPTVSISPLPTTSPIPVSIQGQPVSIQGGNSSAVKVDGSAVTQPISASALPLPAGAATSAKQDTGNTSLGSIDTKTPALGQTTSSASVPVVLASDQAAQAPFKDTTMVSGSFTGSGQTSVIATNGYSNVAVSLTGTFVATVVFEGSMDSQSTWITVYGTLRSSSSALASQATAVNQYVLNTAGFTHIRLRCSAYTSGTVVTQMIGSANPSFTMQTGFTFSRLLDGGGNSVTVGQKTMSSSLPVTLASDQVAPKTYANSAGSVSQNNSITTTASTISAPANAVRVSIQNNPLTSTDCILYEIGGTANSTTGWVLYPGADSGQLDVGASLSIASCSGTQSVNVQWFTQ